MIEVCLAVCFCLCGSFSLLQRSVLQFIFFLSFLASVFVHLCSWLPCSLHRVLISLPCSNFCIHILWILWYRGRMQLGVNWGNWEKQIPKLSQSVPLSPCLCLLTLKPRQRRATWGGLEKNFLLQTFKAQCLDMIMASWGILCGPTDALYPGLNSTLLRYSREFCLDNRQPLTESPRKAASPNTLLFSELWLENVAMRNICIREEPVNFKDI